jgi:hypothetical protein
MSASEIPMNVQFLDCTSSLINRIEGKTRRQIDDKDFRSLQASTFAETETAMVLVCQIGGCSVRWAMDKNSDGTFSVVMRVGISLCSS